jgi:arylsulfatase A-like enzyme
MLAGAAVGALYGLWALFARLPGDLALSTWWRSCLWMMALFAGVGALLAAAAGILAILVAQTVGRQRRTSVAAAVTAALLTPVVGWFLLNELTYSATSEVFGYEAMAMIWHNPAASAEAAWEMGSVQLIVTALFTIAGAVLLYRLSRRAFALAPPKASATRYPVRSLGPLAGITMVVVAIVLAVQIATRPSKALATVFRSAPPFRAFNLARVTLGVDLTGPVPEQFGPPIISNDEYRALIGTPRTDAPNVVLILMESVPAKALRCYGHPRDDITPNIDALADDGILFEHCQAAASFSAYGVVSLMTSLYMLRGEQYDHFADISFPFMALPSALKLAGYQLNLFSSGNETFDKICTFYPPEDFDTFFSHSSVPGPLPDCMRMDDRYAVEAFEKWIDGRDNPHPFYCRFYLQSPHFNYQVPEPWASTYQPVPPLYSNGDGIIHIPPDVLPLLRNQYDNAMRYADYWVGRIRSALDAAGHWNNTVVVIVGDHGEAFMEHGLARHGVHTWEEMIHVPLIFYLGPSVREHVNITSRSRISDTVSTIDIAPALAGLVGIAPHPSWQGRDILAPDYTSNDRPIFSMLQLTRWQEVVTLNKIKYIYDLTDVEAMMFDLKADPAESRNLVHTQPDLADVMNDILGAWHVRQLTYYARQPFTSYIGRYPLDDDLRDRFRQTHQ